ncbi:hypothetical protein S245_030803 [Arachis hypogaea]
MLESKFKPKPLHLHFMLMLILILHQHGNGTEAQSPLQPVKPLSSNHNPRDPSTVLFIATILGTFIFVAAFVAFLRRCTEPYFTQQQSNITHLRCSCCNGGISPDILETFPIVFYSSIKDLRIRKEAPLECAVCLTEFAGNDTLRLLPHCNHVFHPPCIDAWLSSHVTCPVCRANLNQHPSQVAISVITQLSGYGEEEHEEDGSGNRAEQSVGGESIIEGSPLARDASEGQRNNEEDKGMPERAAKGKLGGKGRVLKRSNTTGHSVVEAGECMERYTLRLPEDVRRYIMVNHGVMMTQRSASYNAAESSKKGLCWSDTEGGSSRGKKCQSSVTGKGRVWKNNGGHHAKEICYRGVRKLPWTPSRSMIPTRRTSDSELSKLQRGQRVRTTQRQETSTAPRRRPMFRWRRSF